MQLVENYNESNIPELSERTGIPIMDLRELYLAAKILRRPMLTFGGGRYVLAID